MESRTAPAQTDARQGDRDQQVIPEVAFESLAGGGPPVPWLTSTTGVQTPARWLHEGATPPPPSSPAALTDPTPAGEGSADSPGKHKGDQLLFIAFDNLGNVEKPFQQPKISYFSTISQRQQDVTQMLAKNV